jgi:flagellar basal-body rod protein FlgF
MENSIYIGLARQMAMQRQMDVIANNLANMNTTAYQGERVMFEEYLMRAGRREQLSSVQDYGLARDLRAGEFQATGNSFDVAISGRGFFVVDTPQGPRYTRNGHFSVDAQGRLVTAAGHPVLGQGGRPIQLGDERGAPPTIASDGTVSTSGGATVGRIDLVAFDNEQALRKTGNGQFVAKDAPKPAADARLRQGMLESANVQPIVEMSAMIELSRAYQTNQRLIEQEHDRQRKAIERLARVG